MYEMKYKGFYAAVMEADKLVGENTYELPPGKCLSVYHADEFLGWPGNWMTGPGVFVVPVRPDKGLWFDWRRNDNINTAILPTVKGCNPITGLQTSGFHLERYEEKCPKHKCNFMAEKFCPECNYRWPPQNYISYPNVLWWDTWMTSKGLGRQFFFSEDELRDVATHKIGKENVVHAFGFTFFTPKEKRARPVEELSRGINQGMFTLTSSGHPSMQLMADSNITAHNSKSVNLFHHSLQEESLGGKKLGANYCGDSAAPCLDGMSVSNTNAGGPIFPVPCAGGSIESEEKTSGGGIIIPDFAGEKKKRSFSSKGGLKGQQVNSTSRPKLVKEVSIGAGARIRQALNPDSYPLDSWNEAPAAVMTIYFVFQEKFEQLKARGMRDVTGTKEGMLKNIPVG